jgi:predicted DNA binding protein
MVGEGDDSHLVVCRITMPLHPEYGTYHYALSNGHPELEFSVLTRMELENGELMEDISVAGRHVSVELTREMKAGKGVKSVQTLERSDNQVVYRLVIETTPLAKILKELHLLMRYPTPFDEGVVKLLIVADDQGIQRLLSRLSQVAPGTAIISVHHDSISGPTSILTPRQKEVFRLALAAGYWDVPRRATLADIAQTTNVAKSTLSEMLATIEMKLLREAKDLSPVLA